MPPKFGDVVPGAWPTLASWDAERDATPLVRKYHVTGSVSRRQYENIDEYVEAPDGTAEDKLILLALQQADLDDEMWDDVYVKVAEKTT